jgi:hypothetical protein
MTVVELLMQLRELPATARVSVELRNPAGRAELFQLAALLRIDSSKEVVLRIAKHHGGD